MHLSQRETQIFNCLVNAMRNKEIAVELGLAQSSIATYVHRVCEKMQVKSRWELVHNKNKPVPQQPVLARNATCYRFVGRREEEKPGDIFCAEIGLLRPLRDMVIMTKEELTIIVWEAEERATKAALISVLPPPKKKSVRKKKKKSPAPQATAIQREKPYPGTTDVRIKNNKYYIKVKDPGNPKSPYEYSNRSGASFFTELQAAAFIQESGLHNVQTEAL